MKDKQITTAEIEKWRTEIKYPYTLPQNSGYREAINYIDHLLAENKRKEKIECALGNQIDELSKSHTFCDRHNEDDIDYCPNCTIEEMDDQLTKQQRVVVAAKQFANLKAATDAGAWISARDELQVSINALKQGDSDE